MCTTPPCSCPGFSMPKNGLFPSRSAPPGCCDRARPCLYPTKGDRSPSLLEQGVRKQCQLLHAWLESLPHPRAHLRGNSPPAAPCPALTPPSANLPQPWWGEGMRLGLSPLGSQRGATPGDMGDLAGIPRAGHTEQTLLSLGRTDSTKPYRFLFPATDLPWPRSQS